jgi:hypothetical protein
MTLALPASGVKKAAYCTMHKQTSNAIDYYFTIPKGSNSLRPPFVDGSTQFDLSVNLTIRDKRMIPSPKRMFAKRLEVFSRTLI